MTDNPAPATLPSAAASQDAPVRVIIADDDEDIRVLLVNILDNEPSVELVGVATDTAGAVTLAEDVNPDVAIVDWAMPGGGGDKAAREIKDHCVGTRIVAFTACDPVTASYIMLGSGASAFLEKRCSAAEIVSAIHSAMRW